MLKQAGGMNWVALTLTDRGRVLTWRVYGAHSGVALFESEAAWYQDQAACERRRYLTYTEAVHGHAEPCTKWLGADRNEAFAMAVDAVVAECEAMSVGRDTRAIH